MQRRRGRVPLDDRRPVPQRRRLGRSPGASGPDGRRGRLRSRRGGWRAARRRGGVHPSFVVVLVGRPASASFEPTQTSARSSPAPAPAPSARSPVLRTRSASASARRGSSPCWRSPPDGSSSCAGAPSPPSWAQELSGSSRPSRAGRSAGDGAACPGAPSGNVCADQRHERQANERSHRTSDDQAGPRGRDARHDRSTRGGNAAGWRAAKEAYWAPRSWRATSSNTPFWLFEGEEKARAAEATFNTLATCQARRRPL